MFFLLGQKMDDSVDEVFFSKMLHDDLSDSGVIFAFDSFIGQLKKLFWVMWAFSTCVAIDNVMWNYLFISGRAGANIPFLVCVQEWGFGGSVS